MARLKKVGLVHGIFRVKIWLCWEKGYHARVRE